jgi:pterin-4a-carbinolamine dehydratase
MSEPLDDDDLAVAMEILSDWHREGGALVRVVRLPPADSERLEAAVRTAADELEHHARISREPGASRFTLPSTDAAPITERDVELACRIDEITNTIAAQRRC